jgi:hypothetical protein
MGLASVGASDSAQFVASGSQAATGATAAVKLTGSFNLHTTGTWTGSVVPQRSFDGGSTWIGLTNNGTALSFTANVSESFAELEDGVLYRLNITVSSGGPVVWRFSF